MAILLEDIKAVIDLADGVEVHLGSASEDILIAEVAAGHTRFVGAEVAVVLTAELIRREGYADIDDATLATDALVDEDIPEGLNVGVLVRVLLDELTVDEAELTLRGLVFVLLSKGAKASIEFLRSVVLVRVHLDDILEDEFCAGWVGHKGGGGDVIIDILHINLLGGGRESAGHSERGNLDRWRGVALTISFYAARDFNFFSKPHKKYICLFVV
jgi:hypothetical protein